MYQSEKLLQKKSKLKKKYFQLIENAYNWRELDHAMSDVSEFEATKVLHKINKLKFVIGDNQIQAN